MIAVASYSRLEDRLTKDMAGICWPTNLLTQAWYQNWTRSVACLLTCEAMNAIYWDNNKIMKKEKII